MAVCNRCGRCCYYWKYDHKYMGFQLHKCRELMKEGEGYYSCRRYGNHHGYHIDKNVLCTPIEEYPYHIKGCPWNKEKPAAPWE